MFHFVLCSIEVSVSFCLEAKKRTICCIKFCFITFQFHRFYQEPKEDFLLLLLLIIYFVLIGFDPTYVSSNWDLAFGYVSEMAFKFVLGVFWMMDLEVHNCETV